AAETLTEEQPVELEINADESLDQTQAIAEALEETRFYVEHAMLDQAPAAFEKLEALTSDATILDTLRQEIESAESRSAATAAAEVEAEMPAEEASEEFAVETQSHSTSTESSTIGEFAADLESSLGDSFMPEPVVQETAEPEPAVYAADTLSHDHAANTELGSMVSDLESALGDGFEEPPTTAAPAPSAEPRSWPSPKPSRTQQPAA